MPASWYIIALKSDSKDATYLQRQILSAKTFGAAGKHTARQASAAVANMINGLVSGAQPGQVYLAAISDAGTRSTGTIVCTQANAAGDTITWTYAGLTVVLTEGVDFVRGASDATLATNLAAAIASNQILKGLFATQVSTNTITLTSKLPVGFVGHATMTTSDATAFVITQLSGGTLAGATIFLQNFETGRTP